MEYIIYILFGFITLLFLMNHYKMKENFTNVDLQLDEFKSLYKEFQGIKRKILGEKKELILESSISMHELKLKHIGNDNYIIEMDDGVNKSLECNNFNFYSKITNISTIKQHFKIISLNDYYKTSKHPYNLYVIESVYTKNYIKSLQYPPYSDINGRISIIPLREGDKGFIWKLKL
jgi:hypothetical protein